MVLTLLLDSLITARDMEVTMVQSDRSATPSGNAFSFLNSVDPRRLSEELRRESIRTVATVLAHIDRVQAAKGL